MKSSQLLGRQATKAMPRFAHWWGMPVDSQTPRKPEAHPIAWAAIQAIGYAPFYTPRWSSPSNPRGGSRRVLLQTDVSVFNRGEALWMTECKAHVIEGRQADG